MSPSLLTTATPQSGLSCPQASLLTPSLSPFHQIPSSVSSKYKVNITPLRVNKQAIPLLTLGYTLDFLNSHFSLSPFLQSSLWNPLEPNHRSLYMTIVMTIVPYHATQSALGSAVAPKLPTPMHILWFSFYSIPCATE